MLEVLCIHYGSNSFQKEKFVSVRNCNGGPSKPEGGFWCSPVNTKYGWKEWCQSNNWNTEELKCSFMLSVCGNIIVINEGNDLNTLPWYLGEFDERIDFEALTYSGVDAIWLTANGQSKTRWSQPHSLDCWDCESILVLNPNCIL